MPPIDEVTLSRFYGDVPTELLAEYREFLGSHTLETARINGVEAPYYSCGRGARTLLTFCGAHSIPATMWQAVRAYETDCRVVAIDISGFSSVTGLCEGVLEILRREGAERVVLLGASLAGLIAQIFLKHEYARVDGVILVNTMAMKPGGDKPLSLWLPRAMPGWMLKAVFGRKLRGYFKQALADPRAADGARFGLAHLEEVLALHFTKRKVVNLLSVLFEFGREGYTRADLADWRGRALVIVSEDDQGFRDLEWLSENLPEVTTEFLPAGLGHLPQLAYRDRFEKLIREFLATLD